MVTLKTLLFTIFVPGSLLGLVPWLLLQGSGEVMVPTFSAWLIGLLPICAGIVLYLWCAGAFTYVGHGTPAPIDAPVYLVRAGPYQWVRNPMYIGVLSVWFGEAILFHSLVLAWCGLLIAGIVHLFVVFYEEPSLRRQFGESYETYLQTVPRWLPRYPRS
jgi:protein-S-isoprenylcysteine O-methyltransferase Ste14